jgi:octaprenyl-diphosphate synthase
MFSGWNEARLVEEELAKLAEELPSSALGAVIRYVLSTPGKRVRPLILLFSAQAFGVEAGRAMRAALAVELVHAASLVHDDILDGGVERRGKQSTMAKYGAEPALLAGDYLISLSIELISSYPQPVIAAFARSCMSMSEGEMLDLSQSCSLESYFKCISRKTASLFAASSKIGCLIASSSQEDAARLEEYGMHLGLAYQVLDDLEEYMGIDQGKRSNKASLTLPRILKEIYPEDLAMQMCVRAVEENVAEAKMNLEQSSGRGEMKVRLEKIADQMTLQGLKRCRLQKSLC